MNEGSVGHLQAIGKPRLVRKGIRLMALTVHHRYHLSCPTQQERRLATPQTD